MFWKKRPATEKPSKLGEVKLPGPKDIPELVGSYLVTQLKQRPGWVWTLKGVVRQRSNGQDRFDFRIFDEAQAWKTNVTIKNYTSLDTHPEFVLYQGWFDKASKEVHLEEKKAA